MSDPVINTIQAAIATLTAKGMMTDVAITGLKGVAIRTLRSFDANNLPWEFEHYPADMSSSISTSFEKVSDNTWKNQMDYPLFSEWSGYKMKYYVSSAYLRIIGETIRFETKIKADCGAVNIPGEDVHTAVATIGVSLYSFNDDGTLSRSGIGAYYRQIYESVDEDWTSVEIDLSAMEKRPYMMLIEVTFVSYTSYPPETYWDFPSDNVIYIRNLAVEPAFMNLYPSPIGAREHIIENAIECNLFKFNPSQMMEKSSRLVDVYPLSLTFNPLLNGVTKSYLTAQSILLSKRNPAYEWGLTAQDIIRAKPIYTMTITGTTSPYLPDVEIPISSFQAVVRHGGATVYELDSQNETRLQQIANLDAQYEQGTMTEEEYQEILDGINEQYITSVANLNNSRQSYLSCVVPNSALYADDITARTNGEIIIKKGYLMPDGTRNLEEIIRGNIEYLMVYKGTRNDSCQITAYKTRSFNSPKVRRISGITYFGIDANGRKRIRAAVDLFLRPNDLCVYGDGENENFIVGQITYTVGVNTAVMEVVEQD